MEAKEVPEVILNSGEKMPVIGLGTATAPLPPTDALAAILLDAIRVGYRHFDTAAIYGTEEAVGQAVTTAVDQGLVDGPHQIFVTSKLWNTDAHPDLVLPALKTSLR